MIFFKYEDNQKTLREFTDLFANLSLYSIKLYIKSNMDEFYIFYKTVLYQNLLFEIKYIDQFHRDTLDYMIKKQHELEKSQKSLIKKEKLEQIVKKRINIFRSQFLLNINYLTFYKHSTTMLRITKLKAAEELFSCRKQLNNLKSDLQTNNLSSDYRMVNIDLELIELFLSIVEFSEIIDNIDIELTEFHSNDLEKKAQMETSTLKKFKFIFRKILQTKDAYQSLILAYLVQFFFECVSQVLNNRRETNANFMSFNFYKLISELSFMHFESFSVILLIYLFRRVVNLLIFNNF